MRKTLHIAEEGLRRDFGTIAHAFEIDDDRTLNLTHARLFLGEHAIDFDTLDGVLEGLQHYTDMIRSGHGESPTFIQRVPTLLLRLDQGQQCYDTVKFFATGRGTDYDWSDTTLAFPKTLDADVLKDLAHLELDSERARLYAPDHLVSLLLLKVKLLIDIRHLKITKKVLGGRLPAELWIMVEQNVVRSPISSRFVGMFYKDLVRTEHVLGRQARELCRMLVLAHLYVFHGLVAPYWLPAVSAEDLEEGDEEMARTLAEAKQAQTIVKSEAPAWCETTGALELLIAARTCAEEEFGIVSDTRDPACTIPIAEFLECAIPNLSYLGPPEDRPSERYRRNGTRW